MKSEVWVSFVKNHNSGAPSWFSYMGYGSEPPTLRRSRAGLLLLRTGIGNLKDIVDYKDLITGAVRRRHSSQASGSSRLVTGLH